MSQCDTICISQTLMLVIFYDIFMAWMTIYFDNKYCFHTTIVLFVMSALHLTVSTNMETPVACFFVNSKSSII